jgi:hypothetical protein
MSRARSSAGDTIPTQCRVIEVRVAELRQLFNAIDPHRFVNATLIRVRRNSSSNGLVICLETHGWHCWSTSNGAPGRQMRHRCLASQFTSTSSNALWTLDGGFASCFGEAASV